ncbi:MAG: Imidazolonepropionase, partial [Bacteroidota bacterium]
MNTTLIKNISKIYGIHDEPILKGSAMSFSGVLENAYLLIENDKIASFGPMEQSPVYADHVFDAEGCLVLPAWCDSHTHIVYASSRESEYKMRLKGATYEEIAQSGGGILNSAKKLQITS